MRHTVSLLGCAKASANDITAEGGSGKAHPLLCLWVVTDYFSSGCMGGIFWTLPLAVALTVNGWLRENVS